MLSDETVGIDELAAAIGRPPSWLRRNWLRQHLRHGLPRKLPCGWVWPRRAVAAWLRAGGFSPPATPSPANNNGDAGPDALLAATAEALEQRYGVRE